MAHNDSPTTPNKRRTTFLKTCPDTPTANIQTNPAGQDASSSLQRRDSAFHSLDTEFVNSLKTAKTSTPIHKTPTKVKHENPNPGTESSPKPTSLTPNYKDEIIAELKATFGNSVYASSVLNFGDNAVFGGRGGAIKSAKYIAYRVTERWLFENFELNENMNIPRDQVYEHYHTFMNGQNVDPINNASFGKLMRTVFPSIEVRRLGSRGSSRYYHSGIALKSTSELFSAIEAYECTPLKAKRRKRMSDEMSISSYHSFGSLEHDFSLSSSISVASSSTRARASSEGMSPPMETQALPSNEYSPITSPDMPLAVLPPTATTTSSGPTEPAIEVKLESSIEMETLIPEPKFQVPYEFARMTPMPASSTANNQMGISSSVPNTAPVFHHPHARSMHTVAGKIPHTAYLVIPTPAASSNHLSGEGMSTPASQQPMPPPNAAYAHVVTPQMMYNMIASGAFPGLATSAPASAFMSGFASGTKPMMMHPSSASTTANNNSDNNQFIKPSPISTVRGMKGFFKAAKGPTTPTTLATKQTQQHQASRNFFGPNFQHQQPQSAPPPMMIPNTLPRHDTPFLQSPWMGWQQSSVPLSTSGLPIFGHQNQQTPLSQQITQAQSSALQKQFTPIAIPNAANITTSLMPPLPNPTTPSFTNDLLSSLVGPCTNSSSGKKRTRSRSGDIDIDWDCLVDFDGVAT